MDETEIVIDEQTLAENPGFKEVGLEVGNVIEVVPMDEVSATEPVEEVKEEVAE